MAARPRQQIFPHVWRQVGLDGYHEFRRTEDRGSKLARARRPDRSHTDLRQIRSVQLNTTPTTVLRFMPPGMLEQTYPSTATGKPLAYTIIGTEIKFSPTPDSAYVAEILYTQGIPALSATQTNNTYLTRSPDAYLYGTLVEAHQF